MRFFSGKWTFILIVILFKGFVCAFDACGAQSDVIVVANPKVAESSLSRDRLKAIFLGQMTVWPDGAPIEFVTLKESSDVHNAFLKTYLGRSTLQFNQYWKKQLFSGRGMLPKQFDSERKLLEYVSSTEGAVGYVSAGAGRGAAKILVID